MSDNADERLLQVWKEKWTAAGWEARVLSIDDAKRHPQFSEFKEKLHRVKLNNRNLVYNHFCYYRWLAMASVGGGWMSDYDVLPMNMQNNHIGHFKDGSFAIYSSLVGGGGVPCLMSGSRSEWQRMAFTILDNALQHPGEKNWTDMIAAVDVYRQDNKAYRVYDSVVGKVKMVQWTNKECETVQDKLAAHFSHNAMHEVNIDSIDFRPDFANFWVETWKSKCMASTS